MSKKQTVLKQSLSIFLASCILAWSASANPTQPEKCTSISPRSFIQKCARVTLPILMAAPSAEAGYWAAGTTLNCASWDALTLPGVASVGCTQFGRTDHGVTCSLYGFSYAGPISGVICTQIYTPDELGYRDCTQVGYDTIGFDAGVVCDQYGLDYSAPYCTATAIAQARGVENVMCSQIYCPSCLHYVSEQQCFPDKTWVKVQMNDGTIQIKSMRDLRLGDPILAGVDAQGHEVFSPVIDVPHRQPGKKGAFLKITIGGSSFLVSPEHLIYVAGALDEEFEVSKATTKFAKDLEPGDILWNHDQKTLRLEVAPEPIDERGMYAPETKSGTLVVFGSEDAIHGALVSCYSTFKHPSITRNYFKAKHAFSPPQQIEENTVKRQSRFEDALLSGLQSIYSSGFSENSNPETESSRPQKKALRGTEN